MIKILLVFEDDIKDFLRTFHDEMLENLYIIFQNKFMYIFIDIIFIKNVWPSVKYPQFNRKIQL